MPRLSRFPRIGRLDLQAKVSLVLVAVILPTFLVLVLIQQKLTRPIIEAEMQQIGITSAKTLAAEIVSQRLLSVRNPNVAIGQYLQEYLYSQPHIVRMDVIAKDAATGAPRLVASSVEEEPDTLPPGFTLVESVTSVYHKDAEGGDWWDITVPIEVRGRTSTAPRKLLGAVHVQVSMKFISHIAKTLLNATAAAAAVSVVLLILVLRYFLRKTIANDRKLRRAEDQNLELTEQLHEAQRQIMNTEKLAVMGQLTASFAHEIGTPLNAIGGHLQLLQEEVISSASGGLQVVERFDIINGQLGKIEQVVKSFLQSTAKPTSQRQLVDLNRMVDQALGIMNPRIEAMGVEIHRELDRHMGPVRVVPLELEQIFINLLNNSLDSIQAKKASLRDRGRHFLEVRTETRQTSGGTWAVVSVFDTGEGISKSDLQNVLKPFFTTKRPGEGTGLGLTICQQLARKYGGVLEIDSKEGAWTRVSVRIPYRLGQASDS